MDSFTLKGITKISGILQVPASKSHAQRVLACALLNTNKTVITGLGKSADELAVLSVLQTVGVQITQQGEQVVIQGIALERLNSLSINVGESGLGTRMLTPIMALCSNTIQINGAGSILNRPMHFFEEVLPKLGVKVKASAGKLPMHITGPLRPQSILVDGALSSQFITGLIMGYIGSSRTCNETIGIENPTSIPYIELTLQVLQDFGHRVSFENGLLTFQGPYTWTSKRISIEGDWSSAAFFMVAAALFGEMTFRNLNLNSAQADKSILNVLADFGAQISHDSHEGLRIKKEQHKHFHFDATHSPDLFPILAVLAAYGNAPSSIRGLHRLKHKESDRGATIVEEFSKFGMVFKTNDDTLIIIPQEKYQATVVEARNDHRIIMAAAIMALGIKEKTTLRQPEVCAKSFPDFFIELNQLIKG